jgi:hypothetical protein
LSIDANRFDYAAPPGTFTVISDRRTSRPAVVAALDLGNRRS